MATSDPRAHAVMRLRELVRFDSLIFTRTEYTRFESDYVRAYVVHPEPDGRHAILDITYFIATASDMHMTTQGIRMRGGQYNKGLEVADACWRIVFGSPIPQDYNWREVH